MHRASAELSFDGSHAALSAATRDMQLLAGIAPATRERLLATAEIERIPARTLLFSEGDVPEHLQLVLSGIVDLSRLQGDRECNIMMMVAGDLLMAASALSNEAYLVSARTLTPCRILRLDADAVREEVRRSPQFALNMSRVIAGQSRVALRLILELKCRGPSERLTAFLLRLHDARQPGTFAEIPFSKRQLASRVGMRPETLSRALQTLAANGLLLRGHQIIVNDRAKAEAFCGPDPYPPGGEDKLGVHIL